MMPDAPAPTALKVLEMARAGRFADITERFAPQLRPMVPAETLQTAWDAEMAQLGPVSSAGAPVSETTGPVTVVKVPVTCERGAFTLVASVTAVECSSAPPGVNLSPDPADGKADRHCPR